MKLMTPTVIFAWFVSATVVLAAQQPSVAPATPVVAIPCSPAVIAAPVVEPMSNGTLWTTVSSSLFTDASARKVGDLLTVVVFQDFSSSTSSNHATKKELGAEAAPGTGLFDGFPGYGLKVSKNTTGNGTSTASTRMLDRLTVTVTAVLPNGNLCIQGSRSIKMEKDEMIIIFTGTVRPFDVQADNTVSSILVADQRIETKGAGPIATTRRPGLISRLLGFLW